MTQTIEIPALNTTLEAMTEICERFNLTVKKSKAKDLYMVSGDDPINFFWLGMNLIRQLEIHKLTN